MAKKRVVNTVKNGVIIKTEVIDDKKVVPRWTQEELDYLHAHYKEMTARELAQKMGKSWEAVRGQLKKQKWVLDSSLRKYRQGSTRGKINFSARSATWTPDLDEFLRKNIDTMSYAQLGAALNIKWNQVYRRVKLLGIQRSAEAEAYMRRRSITDINEKRKEYYASDEFKEGQAKRQSIRRTYTVRKQLENRDKKTLKKYNKSIKENLKRIESIDKLIKQLAEQRNQLRGSIKTLEGKIKALNNNE